MGITKLSTMDERENPKTYIRLFRETSEDYKRQHYGFIQAGFKPFSILYPKLTEKYAKARTYAKQNYWQMTFPEAQIKHRGIPFATWNKKRKQYLKSIAVNRIN